MPVQGLAYWQLSDQAAREETRRWAGLQGGRVSRRWSICEVSGYTCLPPLASAAGCDRMLAVLLACTVLARLLLACTVLATAQELLPEAESVEWVNSLLSSFWSLLQPLATR